MAKAEKCLLKPEDDGQSRETGPSGTMLTAGMHDDFHSESL